MKIDDSPRKDAAGFSILPLIENSPPAPSPKKKSKKRKGDDMDVDPEEQEEEAPRKKVKLSKGGKEGAQKGAETEEEGGGEGGKRTFLFLHFIFSSLTLAYPCSLTGVSEEREEEGEKGEGGKK
jgi:hypothetical protein